jgi:6-phosphogluconolactonase (cycloisomerase 2 family)
MVFHPTRDLAYVPICDQDRVATFDFQRSTPDLVPLAGAPTISGDCPYHVAFDRTGQFAYVSYYFENVIKKYSVNPQGWLIENQVYPTANQPQQIVVHESNQFLYVGGTTEITAFSMNPVNGNLTQVGANVPINMTAAAGPSCASSVLDTYNIALDNNSEFLIMGGSGYGGLVASVSPVDGTLGPQRVIRNGCNSNYMELTPGAANIP